jgi:hypothetical protein
VRAKALTEMLPRDVTSKLALCTIDDAGEHALVSLACLLDETLWQTYPQLNERVYVKRRDGDRCGAYFWLSRADTWQAPFFSRLFGIPEIREPMRLSVRGPRYTFSLRGREIVELDLASSPKRSEAEAERLAAVGLNPMTGYTLDRRGLDATKVVHTEIERSEVTVVRADPSFMKAAPLIGDRPPLVAWYVTSTPFDIDLPPQRVR